MTGPATSAPCLSQRPADAAFRNDHQPQHAALSKTSCDNCRLWNDVAGPGWRYGDTRWIDIRLQGDRSPLRLAGGPPRDRWLPRLSVGDAVQAGLDEGVDGATLVVSPPCDRELGWAQVGDRDADNPRAGVDDRVSFGEQGHCGPGRDHFEGLV